MHDEFLTKTEGTPYNQRRKKEHPVETGRFQGGYVLGALTLEFLTEGSMQYGRDKKNTHHTYMSARSDRKNSGETRDRQNVEASVITRQSTQTRSE